MLLLLLTLILNPYSFVLIATILAFVALKWLCVGALINATCCNGDDKSGDRMPADRRPTVIDR